VTTVTALLTCHDRRTATLRCLRGLFARTPPGVDVAAVLVDDGSTDGTAAAVRAEFPAVRVLTGSGDLYWAGGMALAQRAAAGTDPDFLLWLNDDVELADGALADLLATARAYPDAIVAGALADDAGRTTYTGYRRAGRRPRAFVAVEPSGSPEEVDACNGNVVLVPHSVHTRLDIDARLRHGYADLDYGLRARRLGHRVVLAGRHVGRCSRNAAAGSWRDATLPRLRRCRLLLDVKGIPPGPHVRYSARHGGPEWPVYVLACYGRAFGTIALGRPG
jgi:GT2 family glycosyltransferase